MTKQKKHITRLRKDLTKVKSDLYSYVRSTRDIPEDSPKFLMRTAEVTRLNRRLVDLQTRLQAAEAN
jgi:hypothetical protein